MGKTLPIQKEAFGEMTEKAASRENGKKKG